MDGNTYLDAELMLQRMNTMAEESDQLKATIDSTNEIMEELKQNFEGFSSQQLAKEYQDVADTYDDFRNYLQNQIDLMQDLTGNTTRADENA